MLTLYFAPGSRNDNLHFKQATKSRLKHCKRCILPRERVQ